MQIFWNIPLSGSCIEIASNCRFLERPLVSSRELIVKNSSHCLRLTSNRQYSFTVALETSVNISSCKKGENRVRISNKIKLAFWISCLYLGGCGLFMKNNKRIRLGRKRQKYLFMPRGGRACDVRDKGSKRRERKDFIPFTPNLILPGPFLHS